MSSHDASLFLVKTNAPFRHIRAGRPTLQTFPRQPKRTSIFIFSPAHSHPMPPMPAPFTLAEHTASILPHCTFVQELNQQRVRDFLASGWEGKYDETWTSRAECKYTSVRDHVQAIAAKVKDGKLKPAWPSPPAPRSTMRACTITAS